MVVYEVIQGSHSPIILCDACGERITDGAEAAVVLLPTTQQTWAEGEIVPALHAHKPQCLEVLQKRAELASGGRPASFELGWHLCHLTYNAGFTPDTLKAYDHADREP